MLLDLHCQPVLSNSALDNHDQLHHLLVQIPEWERVEVDDVAHLQRDFDFNHYQELSLFIQKLHELADQENHHPEIIKSNTKVVIAWWTHSINGLHENDFIMAAKTDDLFLKIRQFSFLQ